MKVFISWSEPQSRAIAEALRDWLPEVIQSLEPWLSSRDIDAGVLWEREINEKLIECKAGILCLVAENVKSTWIHFEAGALSKTVEKTMVIPYLTGVSIGSLHPPLSHFNACACDREGTFRLLSALNKGESPLPESRLKNIFDKSWGELEAKLANINGKSWQSPPPPTERDLLLQIASNSRASMEAIDEIRLGLSRSYQPLLGFGGASLRGTAAPVSAGEVGASSFVPTRKRPRSKKESRPKLISREFSGNIKNEKDP